MSIVDDLVRENFVVVFTNRRCVRCLQAKELLSEYFKDVRVYDVDAMDKGEEVRAEVNEKYSCTKVPAIFINGEFVGDFADLQDLEKSGVLRLRIKKWKETNPSTFPQSPVRVVRGF